MILFAGPSPSPERYARVALALPIDRAFHYRVPDDAVVEVGDRVRVRFRGRRMTGTVVGIDATPEVDRVLDLEAVLDPDARLPTGILELGAWLADRFGASLGEALDAALPPPLRRGGRPQQVVRVRLADGVDAPAKAEELEARFAAQARVLRRLHESGGDLSERELRQAAMVSVAPVKTLDRKGLVERYRADPRVDPLLSAPVDDRPPPRLNEAQRRAVEVLDEALATIADDAGPRRFLLHGVTGSGKTEVYLRALRTAVDAGRSGIALVPEISLTPQTVARFRARFPRIAVLHSGLSEADRLRQWQRIQRGEIDVVVGARSAIFAPLPNLGLIVLDEEHEPSFKQQSPPRYHAREVALERGRREGAVVILGSATPALETFHAAREGRLELLELPERVGAGRLPATRVVDLGSLPYRREPALIGELLREALRIVLHRREQAILFLNRRGFARVGLCPSCRAPLRCPSCDVSLVLHRSSQRWTCHFCGHEQRSPDQCASCNVRGLRFLGFGTQRVEEELARILPKARIRRMDSDTTLKRGSHEEILGAFGRGEIDVLLGTQMIAKGLDFPKVTLVGIVSADTSLAIPDFRASERSFQLVAQVAGRAGRSEREGRVIVQTMQPDHFSIQAAVRHDYHAFAEQELHERELAGYPPYGHLVRILLSHADEDRLSAEAARVRELSAPVVGARGGSLLGPAPCPVARVRGMARQHVLIKCPKADQLLALIRDLKACLPRGKEVRVTLDVDPASLM